MVKINCKVANIKEVFKLIKLEGKDPDGSTVSMIENCLLVAKDGKITTLALSKTQTVIAFIEYKKIDIITEGEIPIGSIDIFLDYLKRFENDDVVTIETTENKINILRANPKKIANIPMTAKENIDDSLRAEGIKDSIKEVDGVMKFRDTEMTAKMKVNAHHIKQVLDDGSVVSLSRKYPISIGEEVICKVGDDRSGMIETTIPVETKEGTATSSYAAGIDNVFNSLSGNVDVYIAEHGPMIVIKSDGDINVKYVIAPLMEE